MGTSRMTCLRSDTVVRQSLMFLSILLIRCEDANTSLFNSAQMASVSLSRRFTVVPTEGLLGPAVE